jgi:hypothetical protein
MLLLLVLLLLHAVAAYLVAQELGIHLQHTVQIIARQMFEAMARSSRCDEQLL